MHIYKHCIYTHSVYVYIYIFIHTVYSYTYTVYSSMYIGLFIKCIQIYKMPLSPQEQDAQYNPPFRGPVLKQDYFP